MRAPLALLVVQAACFVAPDRPGGDTGTCVPPATTLGAIAVGDLDGLGVDSILRATTAKPYRLLVYPATAADELCPSITIPLGEPVDDIVAVDRLAIGLVDKDRTILAIVRRMATTTVEAFAPDGTPRGTIMVPKVITSDVSAFITYRSNALWFGGLDNVVVFDTRGGLTGGAMPAMFMAGDPMNLRWYQVTPLRAASSRPVALVGEGNTYGAQSAGNVIDLDTPAGNPHCAIGCGPVISHDLDPARGLPFDGYAVMGGIEVETVIGDDTGAHALQFNGPPMRPSLPRIDAWVDTVADGAEADTLALFGTPDSAELYYFGDHLAGDTGLPKDTLSTPLDIVARHVVTVRGPGGARHVIVAGDRADAHRCFTVDAGTALAPCP